MRVPDESHELTRSGAPFRRVENLETIRDWFGHYLVAGKRGCRRITAGVVGAAVDVGSNSIHLLVAAGRRSTGWSRSVDESELLGLGEIVGKRGLIPAAIRSALVENAAPRYRDLARESGAESVTFLEQSHCAVPASRRCCRPEVSFQKTGLALPYPRTSRRRRTDVSRGDARAAKVVCTAARRRHRRRVDRGDPFDPQSGLQFVQPADRLGAPVTRGASSTTRRPGTRWLACAATRPTLFGAARRRTGPAIFVGGTATNLSALRPGHVGLRAAV